MFQADMVGGGKVWLAGWWGAETHYPADAAHGTGQAICHIRLAREYHAWAIKSTPEGDFYLPWEKLRKLRKVRASRKV